MTEYAAGLKTSSDVTPARNAFSDTRPCEACQGISFDMDLGRGI
jgi:hypothetical protein